ncbi:hypothetical protein DL240_14735 [Lujinxingia litoralis]|uniref:DUF7107 domain-containing protein n=1 Tax=Lujinxingia litoralis TaxID=2211119 RepID=A0A328C3Q7_9DELT|nr:hypothetical protein [Lujinxingia litoralis]RAL20928.1 hypothetical protein DL240_14735 [Lujinxingia litoralis]
MVAMFKALVMTALIVFASGCLIVEEAHLESEDGEIGCECQRDTDCNSGVCDDDVCVAPVCRWSSDCDDDERCVNGRCADDDSPGDAGEEPDTDTDEEPDTDAGEEPDTGEDCPDTDEPGTCESCGGCGDLDRCVLNNECPFGALCLDGDCRLACTDDAQCPNTEICTDGICQPDRQGGDQCVYDEDCGQGRCINGFCLERCTDASSCADGESCLNGTCRPDHSTGPQCRVGADCNPDEDCVNARCRAACTCDEDCQAIGGATDTCEQGYCVAAHESQPECTLGSDCADNSRCLDGLCVPF